MPVCVRVFMCVCACVCFFIGKAVTVLQCFIIMHMFGVFPTSAMLMCFSRACFQQQVQEFKGSLSEAEGGGHLQFSQDTHILDLSIY